MKSNYNLVVHEAETLKLDQLIWLFITVFRELMERVISCQIIDFITANFLFFLSLSRWLCLKGSGCMTNIIFCFVEQLIFLKKLLWSWNLWVYIKISETEIIFKTQKPQLLCMLKRNFIACRKTMMDFEFLPKFSLFSQAYHVHNLRLKLLRNNCLLCR
jgi:hypothetical protein